MITHHRYIETTCINIVSLTELPYETFSRFSVEHRESIVQTRRNIQTRKGKLPGTSLLYHIVTKRSDIDGLRTNQGGLHKKNKTK